MRLAYFPLALGTASLALAAPAAANGDAHVRSESALSTAAPNRTLGLVSVEHDLTLDPQSGAIAGFTDITLRPEILPVSELSMCMDSGLRITKTESYDRELTFEEHVDGASNCVRLSVTPALSPKTLRTLRVIYSGRLECKAGEREPRCKLVRGAGYLLEGSAMPAVFDGSSPLSAALPSALPSERILVLRRPSNVSAIATGELLEEHDTNGLRISHFFTPESSLGAYAVVLGNPRVLTNDSLSLPIRLWSTAGEPRSEVLGWASSIVQFLDHETGRTLPFSKLEVAELPAELGLSPTVGHGFVGLSDSLCENETELVLQAAKLWWGTLVMPTDAERTSFMLDGLVKHTELDYQASRKTAEERDAYLAQRVREQRLLLQYGCENPFDEATHEHLRAAVGDEAYARAVKRWASECSGFRCSTDRFRELVEVESGIPLESFFSQWVYRQVPAKPRIGFEQTAPDRVRVELGDLDGMELALELVIELMDGARLSRRVRVSDRSPAVEIDVPGPVRRVFPNPRHDAVVWSRSAQTGDVDLDGEVDGYDLEHCAYRVGQDARAPELNIDFDPRCDLDEDGLIDQSDLEKIVERLGQLRKEPVR